MLAPIPEFPKNLPSGYQVLEDETRYDSEKHLALTFPQRSWTLEEFGYGQAAISTCASNVAVTSPFRILSDQGVKDLHRVVSRLKKHCTKIEGSRIPAHLAGGVYRSKFLRDLCACPVILDHMSTICGTPLAQHSLPSQQMYVNYAPDDISKAVDSWHYDGIGFDYVIMMSDPATLKGGNFEYFQGTKFEVAEMFDLEVHNVRYGISEELPEDRVIKAQFPAAGYAIFQQGNMVVHRAAKLLERGDRITIVPGLVSRDMNFPDPTAKHDIPVYQEPGIAAELARHSAWLAKTKLENYIDSIPMSNNVEFLEDGLENAITDISETLQYFRGKRTPI